VPMKGFSPGFVEALTRYDWPGNVRELIQSLEKAVVAAGLEPTLFPVHLPDHVRVRIVQAAAGRTGEPGPADGDDAAAPAALRSLEETRQEALQFVERRYLDALMNRTGNDIPEACRVSALSRSPLYSLLKKYGLRVPR
jgi:two-component system, NtrC family, response regulator